MITGDRPLRVKRRLDLTQFTDKQRQHLAFIHLCRKEVGGGAEGSFRLAPRSALLRE
jgi:hypothetical protein